MLREFSVKLLSVHQDNFEQRDDIKGDILIVNGVAYIVLDESAISLLGKPGAAFLNEVAHHIYRTTTSTKDFDKIVKDLEKYFEQSEKTSG